MLSAIYNRIVHFFTFLIWFFYHCYHPPVDMWRVWTSGFQWQPTLHGIYLDSTGNNNLDSHPRSSGGGDTFDSAVDFAAVVGCTTGVGFEVAAGLAACGLSVVAGMRGAAALVEDTAARLRERAKQIRKKHYLDGPNNNNSNSDFFAPIVIPMSVDVSDLDSCARFSSQIASLLGYNSNNSSSSAASSPAKQAASASTGRTRSSSSTTTAATATTSAGVGGKKKLLLRVAHLNAAVLMTDFTRTPQGFEAQTATNALGHMVIAESLLQSGVFGAKLGELHQEEEQTSARDCRIVFTSSSGARFGDPLRNTLARNEHLQPETYCQFKMYGDSKALIAAYALLLQRRVIRAMLNGAGPRVSVRALHPGCIASCIVRDSGMYGAHFFAYLQRTAGVAIGAMITNEHASVYVLRLLLGVAGKLKYVPESKKQQRQQQSRKTTTISAEQEKAIFAGEESELFSYLHQFDTTSLAFVLKNEKLLEKVQEAVCETMAPFMPGQKSVLAK